MRLNLGDQGTLGVRNNSIPIRDVEIGFLENPFYIITGKDV
jgi:hypothetical protein